MFRDVIYGLKIFVIEGCIVYNTLGENHRSAFYFYWEAGKTKTTAWTFCPIGNYAN
jgi:hypothetical protein